MTTYGPTTYTLHERLVAARAALIVESAELVDVSVDELAETPRELGYFELRVREALFGEVVDPVRIVAARGRDGEWPLPTDAPFLALVSEGGVDEAWTLVHNSAFPVERGAFRFDPRAGASDGRSDDEQRVERMSRKQLDRAVAELVRGREAEAAVVAEREPDAASGRWHIAESEMPDAAQSAWLPGGRPLGGTPGTPDDAPRAPHPTS